MGEAPESRNDVMELFANRDEPVSVSLHSNPTTGYSWEAEYDRDALFLLDRRYEPLSSLIGAGGTETFTFRIRSKGDFLIVLRLRRPWEDKEIETCRYIVHSV